MRSLIVILFFTLFSNACSNSSNNESEIVIVGGGASGVAAALQAARMGANVTVIESTDWLGGMLTSAGVSAIDGNHKMPSGIWGEFRSHLYDYYGGPDSVFTGWVSNTLFEPSVGNQILKKMVAEEPNIKVLHGWLIDSVLLKNDRITTASFKNEEGETLSISAKVFIDATEYGDLLALAGADYSRTMETFEETKEESAPKEAHPYVQDLTYVAILKDFGKGTNHTIAKPENYDPAPFDCMCKQVCTEKKEDLLDCDFMLDYGHLPNDKYMINWPTKGNDYYAEILEKTYAERDSILQEAKDFTLSWVYFMQTVGGYTNLGIAEGEFPTEDNLPLIPYIRESRRVDGVDRLFLYDIQNPYLITERPIYKTGIAVADYPVDHHRKKNPVPKQIEFPKIPSYNVPYGSLIPKTVDGLIVAEKSISVSNVVNGTTRLQPVVIQIGQASGAAAALSIQKGTEPRDINVRELQHELLQAGMFLMPYMDVQPENYAFESVQRVGLSGIMKGEGIPVAWANETRFYPDSVLTIENFIEIMDRLDITVEISTSEKLTQEKAISILLTGKNSEVSSIDELTQEEWYQKGYANMEFSVEDQPITRQQLAWLIDHIFDPFNTFPVEIGLPNPLLD